MKTLTTNLIVALVATVATVAFTGTSNAQQATTQEKRLIIQPQPYVIPPQPQNQYYFGMQLELTNDGWGGKTLRVTNVTWGSPAQRAGLEFGDEIRTVNGRGFQNAYDSFDAVRMLNRFVGSGGGAPAVATFAYVNYPMPSPLPTARMIVRNVRNGQNVSVIVNPTRTGYGGTPAAAAQAGPQPRL